jgi:hypothetical protein
MRVGGKVDFDAVIEICILALWTLVGWLDACN